MTRPGRRTVLAAAASGLALVVAAVWVVLGTGVLGVRSVVVVGTDRLAPAAVRTAADVPDGHPLLTLDVARVARRVRSLAAVAEVRVDRDWPGTVRIEVTERVAVAVVPAGAGYRLVDRSGTAFWPVRSTGGLPVLDLSRAGPDDAATRSALSVLAALPERVRHRVRTVKAPTAASVRLVLAGGKSVVWGTAGDASRKAAVLAALLRRPGRVYDVSTPDVATVR